MIDPVVLLPFLALGFLGSLHCAGMCGGFAIALARRSPRGRVLAHQLLHGVGKATTYAVLAAALAAGQAWGLSRSEGGDGFAIHDLRLALRWVAAAALILAGLESLGLGGWVAKSVGISFFRPLLEPLRRTVRSLSGSAGAFSLGMVNGLLPCGLSFAAILLAAEHAPPIAFAGAFLFGMTTTPALVAMGAVPRLLGASGLRVARPFLACVTIAFGLALAWRGLSGTHAGGTDDCCGSSAVEARFSTETNQPANSDPRDGNLRTRV